MQTVGGIVVVVAGVIRRGRRYLVARRAPGKRLAGHWEFPGGKVDAGERPAEALRRELREELGVETRIGRRLGNVLARHGTQRLRILFLSARPATEPRHLHDHDALAWATLAELETYGLAEADLVFVRRLRRAAAVARRRARE